MKKAGRVILALLILAAAVFGGTQITDLGERTSVSSADGSGQPLTVTFLDVGQADCILIQSDGETMLVDAGNRADGGAIVDYLNDLGIRSLDYAVGTHPHEDHIGGMATVLKCLDVDCYWMTDALATTKTYENVLEALEVKDIPTQFPQPGETISLGSSTVTVLGPTQDYDDLNNTSIVLKVTCGSVSFLLTGDQEEEAEQELLASGADLSATVLKLGHHGSSTSTSRPFFDAVSPSLGVISCGVDNDYGHPHRETLDLLAQTQTPYYRTDTDGTVILSTDGTNLYYEQASSVSPDGEGVTVN